MTAGRRTLLNPNVDNIQDQHRNSEHDVTEDTYAQCETPVQVEHDTCRAPLPNGATVTWENTTD